MAGNYSWLEEAKAKYYASKNNPTPNNVSRAKGQYYLNKYNELGKEISSKVGALKNDAYISGDIAQKDRSEIYDLIQQRNNIAYNIIGNYANYGMNEQGFEEFRKLHNSNIAFQDTITKYTKDREKYFSSFSDEADYNTQKKNAGYYDKYKNYSVAELAELILKTPEGSEEYDFLTEFRGNKLYNEYSKFTDEQMAEIEAEYNKYYDANGRYQMLERKALNPHMSKITDAELRELEGMRARKREFESKYDYKLIEQVRAQDKAQKEYVLPYLEKPDFNNNSATIKIGKNNVDFKLGIAMLEGAPAFIEYGDFSRNMQRATDEQKSVFAYIYNTQGQEAAKEWYEKMVPTLSYNASAKTQQEWKDFANENWFNAVLTQIASIPANIVKGGVAVSDIMSNIAGVEIDPYDSAHTLVQFAPIVRQEVSKNWGPFGSYAYQLGMGMVDFGAQLLLSKGIGKAAGLSSAATNNIALGIMGTGAAADTITTAKLSGASDAQAIALGTMSGIIEVLCEKASIDTLFGSSKGKLSYFLKNAFTEASEEGISSIANIITDMIVMSDKSEVETLAQKYLEGFTDSKGVYHKANSEAEALAMALTSKAPDVLLDALGGFISGGVLGGISLTSSAISANKAANNIINKNNTQGLIDLGLEMPKDSVAYDTALSLKEQLEVTTADKAKKSVAKLYDSIRQEIGDVVSKYEGNKDAAAYTDYNRALNQYETLNNLVESTDNIVAPNQEATQNIATDTENNAEISTENDLTANLDTVSTNIKNVTEVDVEGKNEGVGNHKQNQLEIIQSTNPMQNDYQVGIRTVDDIRTWQEVLELDDEIEGQFAWGDYSRADAEQALKDGTITVYSSYPIKNGVFVSTSYVQAQEYAGGKNGKVYSKTVPLTDVAWINGDEGQFAKVDNTSKTVVSDKNTVTPEIKEPSAKDILKKMNESDKKAKAESGAQADVSDSSKWSSPRSRWETEKSEAQKEAEKKEQKSAEDAAASSLGEIVSDIEKAFGVSISTGRIRHRKARGIFWVKSEAIRTRVTNALPTISHELGHWFDKKFKLNSLFGIEEVINFSEIDNPGFLRNYKKREQPGEAVAEFVRMYLQNTERAKAMMPSFYSEFVNTVPKKELAKLDEIAKKVNKYMSASAIVRDRAAIITREKARRKSQMTFFDGLKNKWKNAVTKLLDKNEPIKDLGKEAYLAAMQEINSDGIVRFNIESGMSDISGQRLIATDSEGNKIQAKDINGNEMFDNDGEPIYEYEKSLSGVIDTIFDYYNTKISKKKQAEIIDDFSSYLVMRHAPSWLKSGKRVFADDTMNNLDYVNKQKAFYEQQYPQFEAVSEELNRWQKRLMKVWLVDTGYITKEFYEKLWQMYPNYIPLNRDVDNVKGKGKINTVGTAKSAVMRAKGSGADILNPLESIALQVDRYVKNAEKNKVRQEIAKAAKTKEGIGHLIEKVPPNMVAKMVPASEMESALRGILEFGAKYQISVDTIGDQIGAYLEKDALQWTVKGNQGEDIMVVLFDGKKEYYQIHDEMLFNAINSLNYRQTNAIVNVAKALTRFKKTVTTGSNPIFALTNGARDFYTGFLYGSESNVLKYARDHFMAVWDIIKKSDVYTDYEAVGGNYQSSIAVAKEMTELSRKLLKRKPNARVALKAALGLIENLTEAVELAPRLAEYKRTLAEGASQIEALYAASEITVNFKRSGEIGRSLDAFFPYFNASIQGMSKIARAVYQDVQNIKEADGKKAKLKAVTESFTYRQIISSTILAAIVLALNSGDDDKEEFAKLSSYTKNNYYCFHIGNGKFIKIPKAKELAFLESVIERTWESEVWGNDKAFTDFADYMSNLFVPPGMLDPFVLVDGKSDTDWTDVILNLVTDTVLVGTVAEMWANENFTGSPIVPSYLEDLPAEMQYNESTTWFAKQIGKMFNVSPMMVDHFFDSNTGVIWDIMQSFAENRPMALITSKFTADNAYSSDVLNNFYDRRDELAETVAGSDHIGVVNGEAQIEYSYYTSANSVISTINAIKQQAETPEEERMLKIVARDYADYFVKNYAKNEKLADLYEATKSSDILPSKKFSNEYTITVIDENGNKAQRKIILSTESFMNYVANYNAELQNAYDKILSGSYTDAEKVAMIKVAKSKINETLKLEFANQKDGDYGIAKAAGISVADFSYIISSASTDGNSNVSQKEARDILNKSNLSKEQKAVMWNIFNSSWKNNPFGKSGNYEYTANTNNDLTLILKKAFGNN